MIIIPMQSIIIAGVLLFGGGGGDGRASHHHPNFIYSSIKQQIIKRPKRARSQHQFDSSCHPEDINIIIRQPPHHQKRRISTRQGNGSLCEDQTHSPISCTPAVMALITLSAIMVNESSAAVESHHQHHHRAVNYYYPPPPPPPPSHYYHQFPYYFHNYDDDGYIRSSSSSSSNINYWRDSSSSSSMITANGQQQQQPLLLQTSFAAADAAPAAIDKGKKLLDARVFGTLTLTLGSTWSTYTITTTTTCTTSTTNIKVCSPSKGRRRRGNIIGLHRLVFDEEEDEFEEDGIFIAARPRQQTALDDNHQRHQQRFEEAHINRIQVASSASPSIISSSTAIQSGFDALINKNQGRFFIAFASSTFTTTTTSTYYYILTATCKSTTFFQTCGTGNTNLIGTGK